MRKLTLFPTLTKPPVINKIFTYLKMNIPKIKYQEFLNKVADSHIESKTNELIYLYSPDIKPGNPKYNFKKRMEELRIKTSIDKTQIVNQIDSIIKRYNLNLERDNQLQITSWLRLAIILSQKHGISTANILNIYISWRKKEGKRISKLHSNKNLIDLDYFILKGDEDIHEITIDFIGVSNYKKPLSKEELNSKPRKVGINNYKKIKEYIDNAAKDRKCKDIYFETYVDKTNNIKRHEFNGNIESLYLFMRDTRGLDVKYYIFRKVISDFVKTYYKYNRPERFATKPFIKLKRK